MKEIILRNRTYYIIGDIISEACVFIGIDSNNLKELESIELQSAHLNTSIIAYIINDWNNELSPWKAPAIYKDYAFNGGGEDFLEELTNAIQHFKQEYNFSRIFLLGYSLCGLFSLWASAFISGIAGVASCSGSLWFPGWIEFLTNNNLQFPPNIYLSLGKKEELSKHPVLCKVGDCTRCTFDNFNNNPCVHNCVLYMNDGGHFNNPDMRQIAAIEWLINH